MAGKKDLRNHETQPDFLDFFWSVSGRYLLLVKMPFLTRACSEVERERSMCTSCLGRLEDSRFYHVRGQEFESIRRMTFSTTTRSLPTRTIYCLLTCFHSSLRSVLSWPFSISRRKEPDLPNRRIAAFAHVAVTNARPSSGLTFFMTTSRSLLLRSIYLSKMNTALSSSFL